LQNVITPAGFPPQKEYTSPNFCRANTISQAQVMLQGLSAERETAMRSVTTYTLVKI
jgi:hypothetical protein